MTEQSQELPHGSLGLGLSQRERSNDRI